MHYLFNSLHAGYFSCFLSSADFFQNLFLNFFSGIPPECQMVWIKIRPDILLGLIWVQTLCKGYQQTTHSRQRVKVGVVFVKVNFSMLTYKVKDRQG